MDFLTLPERSAKPRQRGITHLLDKGLGPTQIDDLMSVAAAHVDIVKLGWGTSYVTGHVDEKVKRYQSFNIPVCFGGTLFEAAVIQGKLDDYVKMLHTMGIDHIEVSDGTIDVPTEDKLEMIRRLSKEFQVLSEVGSKDETVVIAPYKWVEMVQRELDAGAWKVVTEGRETGTVGIYQPNGEVKEGLIEEIMRAFDPDQLLFEAPNKKQQTWFITHFGANVNLGNIAPEDAISVETLRLGLRGDTLLHFHG